MIALVTAVRDEADRVDPFLDHHRAVGVAKAYVYLDRCRDGTAERLAAHPEVTAIAWDREPGHRWFAEHQNLVAADALRRAAADGVDWLLHLDVDEYAWGGPVGGLDPVGGDLGPALADATADVVRFPTVEAVPEALGDDPPPWALEHVQPDGRFARQVLDPRTDGLVRIDGFLGHPRGKTAVRVAAGLIPEDPHAWRRADGSTPTEDRLGALLHVVVTGAAQWQAKYRKIAAPDHWPNGCPVPFPKQAWKEAALAMSPDEARAYFDAWVAVGAAALGRGRAEGTVVHWPLLRATLGR